LRHAITLDWLHQFSFCSSRPCEKADLTFTPIS
jgi:hypothetical protein